MKAARILAENIRELLKRGGFTQHDLAFACRHSDPWISDFLAGKKEIQFADFDVIADFFGLKAHELLRPGISHLYERRRSERRSGRERRIEATQRGVLGLARRIEPHRPTGKGRAHVVASSPLHEELRKLTADHERRVSALISQAESWGQAPTAGVEEPPPPRRRRSARGPDASKADDGV